jgi:uncharacterized protein DUF5134
MIADVVLRWIVTVLFALSAAECVFTIATNRRGWIHVVGVLLQFVMSIAMAVMAWPWGAALPTIGPLVFFLFAAVWFVVVGIADDDHRVVNCYHALKMATMSWMYAQMNGDLLDGQRGAGHDAHANMPAMDMPDMDMPGMQGSSSGDHPMWIEAINWFCVIGFAVAAVWWLYRYYALRKAAPTQPWHRFLGAVRQATMAAGMAIMFAVLP